MIAKGFILAKDNYRISARILRDHRAEPACGVRWHQRAITADLAVVREAAETNLYGPWLIPDSLVSGARRRDLA
jgi:hypothetical protein